MDKPIFHEYELWEILVPVWDNEGKRFSLTHHEKWDEMVLKIAGGLSLHETIKGKWDDGEVVRDRMIPVRIACSKYHIGVIMRRTAKHYEQKAVMAYVVNPMCVLMKW